MGDAEVRKEHAKNKKRYRGYSEGNTTVDVLTLIVLAITMVGVFWYACLTQQILNADMRPYIVAFCPTDAQQQVPMLGFHPSSVPLPLRGRG